MANEKDKRYLDKIEEIGHKVYEFYNMSDRDDLVMVYEMKEDLIYSYIYSEFMNGLNERSQEMLEKQYLEAKKSGGIVLFIRDPNRRIFKSYIIRKPMETKLIKEIEEYVNDWHWDSKSKRYTLELGKFLFSFMDYIDDTNLSERVKKKHQDNTYMIGKLESGYGYRDKFYHEDLMDGPFYVIEFERKVSNSKYAVQSYESTWKKLDKFIRSGIFEKYMNRINERLTKELQGS